MCYPPLKFGWVLRMSLTAIVEKLDELAKDGMRCEDPGEYVGWSSRAKEFLRKSFDRVTAMEFGALQGDPTTWWIGRGQQVGMLEGLASYNSEESIRTQAKTAQPSGVLPVLNPRKVFVVHGHDHGAKDTVARYLERLGLEVTILHEKPNEGQTVIEKIETHSEVGFAVVLLTPDDVGASKSDPENLKARARQNVVLELGYFLGKLKRSRVCALYIPGVEIPSDYQGVLYIELDSKGAWRTKLAQELSNARLPINVAGLLNS
jgi:predicted nucleotide-binding protein